jgi:hypothetical protein
MLSDTIKPETTSMKPQSFWAVELGTLYVCINCLERVYWRQIPTPACPGCHAVSSYESFQLEQVQDWGSTSLIKEAEALVSRHAGGKLLDNVRHSDAVS